MSALRQLRMITVMALLLPAQLHSESIATTIQQLIASPTSTLHAASQMSHGLQRRLFYHILSDGGLLTDTYQSLYSTGIFTNPRVLPKEDFPQLYHDVRKYIKPALLENKPLFIFLVDEAPLQHGYLCQSKNLSSHKELSLALPVTHDELNHYNNESLTHLLATKAIITLIEKKVREISTFSKAEAAIVLTLLCSQVFSGLLFFWLLDRGGYFASRLVFLYYLFSIFTVILLPNLKKKKMIKAFEKVIQECTFGRFSAMQIGNMVRKFNAAGKNTETPCKSAVHYYSETNRVPSDALLKKIKSTEESDALHGEDYFKAYLLQKYPLGIYGITIDSEAMLAHTKCDTPLGTPATPTGTVRTAA